MNEEMMKFAPSIEKMQRTLRRKLTKQMRENDEKLQQSLKEQQESEFYLKERLRELEAQNSEMSAMISKDKVKIGEYALKSSIFDKS